MNKPVRCFLFAACLLSPCILPIRADEELGRFLSPGPFAVGVRTAVFTDSSRADEYAGEQRRLVTDIWYPVPRDAAKGRPTTFAEFFGPHQEAAARFVEHFGGTLEEVNRRFKTVAERDAPLAAGRFPLLVFSHGNGGVRHQNVFQLDHLASHGYVVATPDHTGNAGVTPLPERALAYDRSGRTRSARDRPLDASFLISELLALGTRPGSWLHGALDAEKIGVLGHSFGGYTACRAAELDRRVKAILPMTVAYGHAVSVPVFLMLAGRDRTMGEAGNHVARLYYQVCTGPKFLLDIKRAGHFSFSDMDRINPAFGDGIGRDKRTGEEFLSIDRAKRFINAYGLAFFDHFLRGDAAAGRILHTNLDSEELLLAWNDVPGGAESSGAAEAAKPTPPAVPSVRSALVVTGEDVPAHDWRETSPLIRHALEKGGFEVRVVEDPAILETAALSSYNLIVLNFRNPPARDAAGAEALRRRLENLASHVRRGTGLITLHFAVNAFQDLEEFGQLVGRVWIGKRGAEKLSGHGDRGKFAVRVAQPAHELAAGLTDFEADDELYSRLVGDAPIDVLLEAHSAWSGRVEPIAWTLRCGEGRSFVTVLGHDARALESPALEKLLAAAAAWSAARR